MINIKRIIGVVLVLVLFIQTTSFTFALSSNELEESNGSDIESQEIDDPEVIPEDEGNGPDIEPQGLDGSGIVSEIIQESRPNIDRVTKKRVVDAKFMSEFEDAYNQVQTLRSKEGNRALSQEEIAGIALAEERAAEISFISQEIQEYIDASLKESSSRTSNGIKRSGSFSGGDGTKYDPYIITLPEEMEYISDDLSAYYSLDNDIDMSLISWVPTNSFTGQFNGNMHTISNLTVASSQTNNIALFGSSSGAIIENLKLQNADISGNNYVGSFVGIASNSTLRNLILDSSTISGKAYVGGIVGACTGTTEIYECNNNGTVNNTGNYTGGIVGFMFGVRVDECVFEGVITGIDYVGGIAGVLQGDSWESTNAGKVNGNVSVGGIAGFFQCTAGNMYWLMFCLNSGDVTGNKEVAGIAGYALSVGSGIINIQRCGNQGVIAANDLAGGITGDSACNLYIQRPYNTGEIIANYIQGGLVGRLNISSAYDGVLRYSYNAGKVGESVKTTQVAGMLIGRNFGSLVNNLYYIPGPVSAVGLNQASSGLPLVTTAVSKIAMRTIHTTLGAPLIKDDNWINSGYPIIDGINYVFGEDYRITYPDITVKGTIKYNYYYDGKELPSTQPLPYPNASPLPDTLPLKNHTVEIYYKDGTLLDATKTNNSGEFSTTFETDLGFPKNGYDIYISVVAENSYAYVTGWTNNDKTRTYKSPAYPNTQIPVLNLYVINVSQGPQSSDLELDAAFNILHWIAEASDYYEGKTGYKAPLIQVKNEKGYDKGSYCLPSHISISDQYDPDNMTFAKDQYDCSVILHEFGHHIMNSFADIPLGAGGTHYYNYICGSEYDEGTSTYYLPNGPNYKMAYSEGFAHFFSCAARNDPVTKDYYLNGASFYGADISTLDYYSNSTAHPISVYKGTDFMLNAAYEVFTAGAMWDLLDQYNNYSSIDAVFSAKPYKNVFNEFYDNYMDSVAVNNERDVWEIFDQSHVSFDTELPVASIIKVSSTAYQITCSDNVCVDRWEIYIGSSTSNSCYEYDTPMKKNDTVIVTFPSALNSGTILTLLVWDPQGAAASQGLPDGRTGEYKEITFTV